MNFNKINKAIKTLRIYLIDKPKFNPLEMQQGIDHKEPNVVVYIHIYHRSYLKRLKKGLKNFPNTKFLVSTPNQSIKLAVEEIFIKRPKESYRVEIVPNRGRNFGPMINIFAPEILKHEILVHVHSKSPNKTIFRYCWSHILWSDLFLSRKKIEKNYLYFLDKSVGVLSTFSLAWSPRVFSWGGSFETADSIFPLVTKKYTDSSNLLYPIGGMFWARVEAIRPILENIDGYDLFPEEFSNLIAIRTGSTTEHAIERLIGLVPEFLGFRQIVRVHERRKTVTSQQFLSKMIVNS